MTEGSGDDAVAAAKALVWAAWSGQGVIPDERAFAADVEFHGPAPIGAITDRSELFATVYSPTASAITNAVRSPYVFLGGVWNDEVWVATTGNTVGTFSNDWLGIPASLAPVTLRFGEFYRVVDGQIVEVRCLYDILAVAAQAGFELLPPVRRPAIPVGPALSNGLSLEPQDPAESAFTLQLVNDMLGGCNRLDGSDLASMGMAAYWHDDMAWYGPTGIGATLGFAEFQSDAQGPSVASFPNRRGGFHQARIADGLTAAFTGWPSLQGAFNGQPFRGIQPTGGAIGQNIMDFYVRRDEKLHENWILIDLIDFATQCGVDLLARIPEMKDV